MLLQAITEGVAINHPDATLLVLLVDERPEEVSEMIAWGRGEVIASSFDQPAERHVDVTEMVLEHARRLVENGKDVVIVLDSLTRMARAHNTVERGTGRTLVGRSRCDRHGEAEGVLRLGALGRSAARRRLAHDHRDRARRDGIADGRRDLRGVQGHRQLRDQARPVPRRRSASSRRSTSRRAARGARRSCSVRSSSTRVYTLRRGLQQMPPQSAMEWLIKRIAGTAGNDALLAGIVSSQRALKALEALRGAGG